MGLPLPAMSDSPNLVEPLELPPWPAGNEEAIEERPHTPPAAQAPPAQAAPDKPAPVPPKAASEQASAAHGEPDPIEDIPRTLTDEPSTTPETATPTRASAQPVEEQSIRDAVRLLLHGELRWQGELSPGVFARLAREDTWDQDPAAPGALVKGTLVRVQLDLPALGRVEVRGLLIKDSVRLTIVPQDSTQPVFAAAFEALRARLQQRGLESAQVHLGAREDV
jgi:hypothetical protein